MGQLEGWQHWGYGGGGGGELDFLGVPCEYLVVDEARTIDGYRWQPLFTKASS